MADAMDQKAGQPDMSMEHEEKIEAVSQVNRGFNNSIQDYEARSIDLRTFLALLVVPPAVWTIVWLIQI
jgi:hypothetical protein